MLDGVGVVQDDGCCSVGCTIDANVDAFLVAGAESLDVSGLQCLDSSHG